MRVKGGERGGNAGQGRRKRGECGSREKKEGGLRVKRGEEGKEGGMRVKRGEEGKKRGRGGNEGRGEMRVKRGQRGEREGEGGKRGGEDGEEEVGHIENGIRLVSFNVCKHIAKKGVQGHSRLVQRRCHTRHLIANTN